MRARRKVSDGSERGAEERTAKPLDSATKVALGALGGGDR